MTWTRRTMAAVVAAMAIGLAGCQASPPIAVYKNYAPTVTLTPGEYRLVVEGVGAPGAPGGAGGPFNGGASSEASGKLSLFDFGASWHSSTSGSTGANTLSTDVTPTVDLAP